METLYRKLIKAISATFISIIAISSLSVIPASAEVTPPSSRPVTSKPSVTENLEAKKAEFCTRIETKIATMITRVDERLTKRSGYLDTRYGKLTTVITLAQSYGIDTTEVEGYIETMEDKVADVTALMQSVKNDLEAIDTSDCVNNIDAIKASIQAVVAKCQEIKTAKQANKDYFDNTLKPALQNIREQIKALKTI